MLLGTGAEQAPSDATELAVAIRRRIRGAQKQGAAEEPHPWVNSGAVVRPLQGQVQGNGGRQWQQSNAAYLLSGTRTPHPRIKRFTPGGKTSGRTHPFGLPRLVVDSHIKPNPLPYATPWTMTAGSWFRFLPCGGSASAALSASLGDRTRCVTSCRASVLSESWTCHTARTCWRD